MSAFVESASAVSSTPNIQTNLEGHTHFSKVTCIHSWANPTPWGPGMSYLGLPMLQTHHEKNQPYPWVIGSQESDCSQGVECLGCRENLGQPSSTRPGWTHLPGRCREARVLPPQFQLATTLLPTPTLGSPLFPAFASLPSPHQLSVGDSRRHVGAQAKVASVHVPK